MDKPLTRGASFGRFGHELMLHRAQTLRPRHFALLLAGQMSADYIRAVHQLIRGRGACRGKGLWRAIEDDRFPAAPCFWRVS
jgi:hypothetical protein